MQYTDKNTTHIQNRKIGKSRIFTNFKSPFLKFAKIRFLDVWDDHRCSSTVQIRCSVLKRGSLKGGRLGVKNQGTFQN